VKLSEIEGSAGEKSQSMLVAQLLLCAGFLVFLISRPRCACSRSDVHSLPVTRLN